MGDNIISGAVTIALGVIGVASLAVLLSRNSATSDVLRAAGNALSTSLDAATRPVSGFSGFDTSMLR